MSSLSAAPVAPTSAELMDDGPRQRRWMSLPGSRIVVNPYDYTSRALPAEQAFGPGLPLHVGYYAGGGAANLREMLMLYAGGAGTGDAEIATGWEASFDPDGGEWTPEPNAALELTEGRFRLTAAAPGAECSYCAYADALVEVDLDRTPWIRIETPESAGRWSLKVLDEGTTQEIALQHDTDAVGVYAYDVADATGWTGRKRLKVRIYGIGIGKPVTVASLRFLGFDAPARTGAASPQGSWTPHELLTTGTLAGRTVTARDRFSDGDALLRTFTLGESADGRAEAERFTLAGQFNGSLAWDARNNVLSVESTTCSYAIAVSGAGELTDPQFTPTKIEFLAGERGDAQTTGGIWALEFKTGAEGATSQTLLCGVGFASAEDGRGVAVDRALLALNGADGAEKEQPHRRYWDDYLSRVPRPAEFALQGVDPAGVSPENVRRQYYAAWVFLAANALPAMPETGFGFPQLACGKPSLWLEGHPKARPSASWESFFAMQFYGLMDPETAWRSYEGMMSLVDESGKLGGESLPSRKAQTAYILYRITGDAKRLAGVYEPLKRHLLWAGDNPRWIHGPHNYLDEKDADFVVSLIYDLAHMQRIAASLGREDEKTFWTDRRNALIVDYKRWFWTSEEDNPVEIYFAADGRRSYGNGTWTASGLCIPEIEPGPLAEGLLRRLHEDYKPERAFAGLGVPKYPEVGFLVYGLHDRGFADEAGVIANVAVRDIARSNMFAEQYMREDFPHPDGVRPSVFGAALLIDMVWMKNGLRFERGLPSRVRMKGESGAVVFPDALLKGLAPDYATRLRGTAPVE